MSGSADLDLRCRCGVVRGVVRGVSPRQVNRVVCQCRWCQRYAREMGVANEVLDDRGGTEVLQLSPRSLEILEGHDRLGCLQLTSKGPLRWYATCCGTPLANTLANARYPFVAILTDACIDKTTLGGPLERYAGPVRARIHHDLTEEQARACRGTKRAMLAMLLRLSGMTLGWALRGDHRHSPFFDARSRQPIASPSRARPVEAKDTPRVH